MNYDEGQARLRAIEECIRVKEAEEREESERRRVEDERRARWDSGASNGLSLTALKQQWLELRAQIEQRQTHVQGEAQRELTRQRQQRLAERAAQLRAELADIEADLPTTTAASQ